MAQRHRVDDEVAAGAADLAHHFLQAQRGEQARDRGDDPRQRQRAAAFGRHVLGAEDDAGGRRHVGDRLKELTGQTNGPSGQLGLLGVPGRGRAYRDRISHVMDLLGCSNPCACGL